MAKNTIQFVCRSCGNVQNKWMGKCPDCGQWDSLEEFKPADKSASLDPHASAMSRGLTDSPQATAITDLDIHSAVTNRLPTGISELDRVLGGVGNAEDGPVQSKNQLMEAGGLVPGSAVLLGGDPGIGKSTLLLQAASSLAQRGRRVLYVTSEESPGQLQRRAERLNEGRKQSENLFVLADTNLARVLDQARKVDPAVLVIDSIQMLYKGDLSAAPGSVTQLRTCCLELVYHAKVTGVCLVLVGHVTKKGVLAGPRLLEHMVDTVLYFEGDRYHSHRVVRAIKNRFGTTWEVGLFEMTGAGLQQVIDGSGLLSAEYEARSGSVVCPVLQGSRCLLVEMQALTATGFPGSVKRKVSGLDASRLAMLIAVLEKRADLRLSDQDVFASSVGGMKVTEPAVDLAVALAIAGAHHGQSLGKGVCAVGEIGLGGEVRHCQQIERRIHEAARMGFAEIICPRVKIKTDGNAKVIPVKTLDQALALLG